MNYYLTRNFPNLYLKKSQTCEGKKIAGDIIILHMCTKIWSETIFLVFWATSPQMSLLFSILGIFLPFYPLTAQKMKISRKMKKTPGDIITLHKCTKNYDYMLYCSWDMAHDGCNCCFSFWVIFCPFNPLTA